MRTLQSAIDKKNLPKRSSDLTTAIHVAFVFAR